MKKEKEVNAKATVDEAVITTNDSKVAPILCEGIIAKVSLPVKVENTKAYAFLEAGLDYANWVIPEFHFVGDGVVLLELELRNITNSDPVWNRNGD